MLTIFYDFFVEDQQVNTGQESNFKILNIYYPKSRIQEIDSVESMLQTLIPESLILGMGNGRNTRKSNISLNHLLEIEEMSNNNDAESSISIGSLDEFVSAAPRVQ